MSEENDKIKMATESEQIQDKLESTTLIMRKKDSRPESNKVLDDTWAELTQDWQAQPTAKTDIATLVKRTRRRTYGAKLCFVLNILATLAIFIAFFYGIYQGEWGEPVNIYLGFGSLLSVAFVYFEMKVRVAAWSQLCDSPEKAIDNAISSCESSMKYMRITQISLLPFLPLVNWFIYTLAQTSTKAVLPAYLIANGLMFVVYIVVDYLYRKRKKEHQQLVKVKLA
ncbi:hypothetical protein FGD67_08455 [Colwellia sp. M166]|uniref:hypothetical protein n=1 Tax=Colwellia sp. M166 TaxID=2583805 RepID=UPI00211EEAB2|nr:hypothetical protein [Colwellia sp. M166]UUO23240.1 hypothetical protein FGD67_08455 [Colwellia sp. M166]|tara:strand:+ start:189 stop:866 length:678 start_codon:yes stop_codon:yes gene_type:complete